jgi:hypothetical protein
VDFGSGPGGAVTGEHVGHSFQGHGGGDQWTRVEGLGGQEIHHALLATRAGEHTDRGDVPQDEGSRTSRCWFSASTTRPFSSTGIGTGARPPRRATARGLAAGTLDLLPRPGLPSTFRVDPEALDYAADQPDLTLLSYSPNQQGQLVRPWMPLRPAFDHPGSQDRLHLVHRIAHDLGATAIQVALAWHLAGPTSQMQLPAGSSVSVSADLPARRVAMIPVIGASSVAQLDESLGALDVVLSDEHRSALDGV